MSSTSGAASIWNVCTRTCRSGCGTIRAIVMKKAKMTSWALKRSPSSWTAIPTMPIPMAHSAPQIWKNRWSITTWSTVTVAAKRAWWTRAIHSTIWKNRWRAWCWAVPGGIWTLRLMWRSTLERYLWGEKRLLKPSACTRIRPNGLQVTCSQLACGHRLRKRSPLSPMRTFLWPSPWRWLTTWPDVRSMKLRWTVRQEWLKRTLWTLAVRWSSRCLTVAWFISRAIALPMNQPVSPLLAW